MSNPYELRFQVLQMARDLELQQYEQLSHTMWEIHSRVEKLIEAYNQTSLNHENRDLIAKDMSKALVNLQMSIPKMPTSDQIKQKAKELYEFVENK